MAGLKSHDGLAIGSVGPEIGKLVICGWAITTEPSTLDIEPTNHPDN